jgi:Cu+-exporting ATPase
MTESAAAVRRRAPASAVACTSCGSPVDPLRAWRVAFVRERFRYFCSQPCRDRYNPEAILTPLPAFHREPSRGSAERVEPRRGTIADGGSELDRTPTPSPSPAPLPVPSEPRLGVQAAARALAAVADPGLESADAVSRVRGNRTNDDLEIGEPVVAAPELVRSSRVDEPREPAVSGLLLGLALLGSLLTLSLFLAGDSGVALTARVVLIGVACAALVAEAWLGARDESELHPGAELAGSLGAVAAAVIARVVNDARANDAVLLSAVIVGGTAVNLFLLRRARRPLDLYREQLSAALDRDCVRVVGEDVAPARALDLRPGEEVLVEAGQLVPADASITAGSATVLPWLGAKATQLVREGDVVVAGARVVEGTLRAVVGWAGHDRAWTRLTLDPRRRADLKAPLARFGRLWAERAAPIGAMLAALAAFASDGDFVAVLMMAAAVQAALSQPALAALGAVRVLAGIFESLGRGVAFRSAEGFDRASRVSTVVFCARGTLLLGEPEVANIDALAGHEPEQVLALVAGAESGAQHPVASAVTRAARARGVRPDGVRSPTLQPGLGVTAVASTGQALIVGSRALMLREHVSVAMAERAISDLEAMGRSVLLVALGGRLIGVVGLQDGLRPGARAAVQHLLDVGLEPVLLSGDSRETCEALGRTLDIDHIRAEVPPAERGEEVRRLEEGGAVAAVVGRIPSDDAALSAAHVAVALRAAGSTSAEWAVQLASDDVRDAAFAMRVAHDCRRETRIDLGLVLAPAVTLSVLAALGLAPAALAPFAAMAGGVLALLRARK